jgi:hypothetical protein
MNVITARKAISLFPWATFITRNSYVSILTGNQKKIASWKAKYSARGFKIKDNFQEPFPQDFWVGERYVGDSQSWSIDIAGECYIEINTPKSDQPDRLTLSISHHV